MCITFIHVYVCMMFACIVGACVCIDYGSFALNFIIRFCLYSFIFHFLKKYLARKPCDVKWVRLARLRAHAQSVLCSLATERLLGNCWRNWTASIAI